MLLTPNCALIGFGRRATSKAVSGHAHSARFRPEFNLEFGNVIQNFPERLHESICTEERVRTIFLAPALDDTQLRVLADGKVTRDATRIRGRCGSPILQSVRDSFDVGIVHDT